MTKTLCNLKAGDVIYGLNFAHDGIKVAAWTVHSFGKVRVRLVREDGFTHNVETQKFKQAATLFAKKVRQYAHYFVTKEEAEDAARRIKADRDIQMVKLWLHHRLDTDRLKTDDLVSFSEGLWELAESAKKASAESDDDEESEGVE